MNNIEEMLNELGLEEVTEIVKDVLKDLTE